MAKIVKVESLFEDLGRKVLSADQLQADPALVAQGWERRFTTDLQRVPEVTKLYSHLGYEVCAEPLVSAPDSEDCGDCHSHSVSGFRTIYTRPKPV